MFKIEGFLDFQHVLVGAKDDLDTFRLTMYGHHEIFDGLQGQYRYI